MVSFAACIFCCVFGRRSVYTLDSWFSYHLGIASLLLLLQVVCLFGMCSYTIAVVEYCLGCFVGSIPLLGTSTVTELELQAQMQHVAPLCSSVTSSRTLSICCPTRSPLGASAPSCFLKQQSNNRAAISFVRVFMSHTRQLPQIIDLNLIMYLFSNTFSLAAKGNLKKLAQVCNFVIFRSNVC